LRKHIAVTRDHRAPGRGVDPLGSEQYLIQHVRLQPQPPAKFRGIEALTDFIVDSDDWQDAAAETDQFVHRGRIFGKTAFVEGHVVFCQKCLRLGA
jgi:hypothetical protein